MAFPHLDETRPWTDRGERLRLVRITPEAPDVATFAFRPERGGWFRYRPGQFVTLELPLPGGPALRTYTLSSSPSRPLSVAVTVKAQPGSLATRWMLERLKVGDLLTAYGPGGDFSCHAHPAQKYLFVSAGSGITPMMSMARWLEDAGEATDIAFLHCARKPSDILFRHELERMAAGPHPFALAFAVAAPERHQPWSGHRGRISRAMIEQLAPDIRDREVFCCGPAPFMAAVRALLAGMGCDPARYHEESFQPPAPDPAAAGPDTADAPAAGPVRFVTSDVEASGAPGDTILAIARAAGLNIPTGCTMGLCGTCRVLRLSGETAMAHQGGIREEDEAEGYVLACCTRPLGRVEIEA